MRLDGKKLHFMGIGGIGVSALAEMAKAAGAIVSGCDRQESGLTRALAAKGIACHVGHNPEHLTGQDLLIYTSAIRPDHPERLAAGERQEKRGAFLARLMEDRHGVGVSGTHGKTTTSWLLANLFIESGHDPAVFIGGMAPGLPNGNYRLGSGRFIAELDESDESFLLPRLDAAIATNLESEHLSHYGDYDTLKAAFRRYAAGVEQDGLFVAGLDGGDLAAIYRAHPGRKLSFGMADAADTRAGDIETTPDGSSFALVHRGKNLGRFSTALPGRHNILNSLAALGTSLELGLDPEALRAALPRAGGVGRRLERLGTLSGATAYSDYAHHPTEVNATLSALRQSCRGGILAVFQPHLFTRTRDYADAFGEALTLADAAIIADIYPAREDPIPGVSAALLLDKARQGDTDVSGPFPLAEAVNLAADMAGGFAAVVFMGAGDIDAAARELVRRQYA